MKTHRKRKLEIGMPVRLKVNTAFGTPRGTPGVISSLSPWFTITASCGEILCCEHEVAVIRTKAQPDQVKA